MNADYVNYICGTVNWYDAVYPGCSAARLRLLVFTGLSKPPKWIVEQARMKFRETERTIDMDWVMRARRMMLISKM